MLHRRRRIVTVVITGKCPVGSSIMITAYMIHERVLDEIGSKIRLSHCLHEKPSLADRTRTVGVRAVCISMSTLSRQSNIGVDWLGSDVPVHTVMHVIGNVNGAVSSSSWTTHSVLCSVSHAVDCHQRRPTDRPHPATQYSGGRDPVAL